MNWDILKSSIAEIIKTNGNNEITGQLLQNVLSNIISNVGENSTFVGVATKETSPGYPDGPVFYLASEQGVYPNFSGIVVEKNEIVFLKWDSPLWKKLSISVRVDVINDLITGGTDKALSAEMGKELKEMLEEQSQEIEKQSQEIEEQSQEIEEHKGKLDILYKVVLSFSGGGNKKKGTSVSVTLSWTVKVNGTNVNPQNQKLNGEVLSNDIRSKTFTGVTDDTTYTLVVDGVTASQSVKFYNPAYFGVVDPSYTVGNDVTGLTELTNYGSKSYTKSITSTGSKKAVYLYPSALGNLTSIKDGNNFDVTGSFTKVTGLTINGESYVGYILTKEASLNNVTFKFS